MYLSVDGESVGDGDFDKVDAVMKSISVEPNTAGQSASASQGNSLEHGGTNFIIKYSNDRIRTYIY